MEGNGGGWSFVDLLEVVATTLAQLAIMDLHTRKEPNT